MISKVSIVIAIVIALSTTVPNIYAISPYDSGFKHGCSDAKINDPGDRYINEEGKGPAYHTSAFMNGYDAGFIDCSSTHRDNGYYQVNTAIDDSNFDDHSVSQPQNQQVFTNQAAGCPSQIINGDCIIGQTQDVDNTFGQANRND